MVVSSGGSEESKIQEFFRNPTAQMKIERGLCGLSDALVYFGH